MNILKSDLEAASKEGIITHEQVEKLWTYFETLRPEQAKFQGLHVLYYFGGLLMLASMSWFLTKAWDNGFAIMAVTALFALIYVVMGNSLWKNQRIPAGLMITAAVALTPVFILGFFIASDISPEHKENQLIMSLGTSLAASLALRFYPFPFITLPLTLSLWCSAFNLLLILLGKQYFSYEENKIFLTLFGLLLLAISYYLDLKYRIDFAFWTYLYGMTSLWIALTLYHAEHQLTGFAFFLINLFFVIVAVFLRRRIFLIYGATGVFWYLSYLAWDVFKDSMAFPLVLAALGGSLVYLGVQYQRNRERLEAHIEGWFPTFMLKWRPPERA